jgi:sugar fermentation stimulation protein A
MMFFGETLKARFVSRQNRFTILCKLREKTVRAYLPNPGRLWELLLPNATIYLEKNRDKNRKLHYTAVAIETSGKPISLHTHRANEVVKYLIECNRVPGLEDAVIVKKEVAVGRSRFDFLLKKDGKEILLEVKSCTLFSKSVAMFPDAVTSRGKRHIEELARQSKGKREGVVLFLVNSGDISFFMPEYHTDLAFSKSLIEARKRIRILPLSIGWNRDLSLKDDIKILEIPWKIVEAEAKDRGCYSLILRLPRPRIINVGGHARTFPKGYYIYVGSAKKNLSKRIERHKRRNKKLHWYIDFLRQECDFLVALPICSEDDLECEFANDVKYISEREFPGFGSSDCRCNSHLFYMTKNPLSSPMFHSVLQFYRMERPVQKHTDGYDDKIDV